MTSNNSSSTLADSYGEYRPKFIRQMLKEPPLLPNQSRGDFLDLFQGFEVTEDGKAATEAEYLTVFILTKLAAEIIYYTSMKNVMMAMQRRAAAESLIRKTHEGAAMVGEGVAAKLKALAKLEADKLFKNPEVMKKSVREFEAAGYGPSALEGEAFLLSLNPMEKIERVICSAEKRFSKLSQDLRASYARRTRMRNSAKAADANKV